MLYIRDIRFYAHAAQRNTILSGGCLIHKQQKQEKFNLENQTHTEVICCIRTTFVCRQLLTVFCNASFQELQQQQQQSCHSCEISRCRQSASESVGVGGVLVQNKQKHIANI